jgi:hypothetical protein
VMEHLCEVDSKRGPQLRDEGPRAVTGESDADGWTDNSPALPRSRLLMTCSRARYVRTEHDVTGL